MRFSNKGDDGCTAQNFNFASNFFQTGNIQLQILDFKKLKIQNAIV